MISLKDFRAAIKKDTARPKWVLCVDEFPSWVSSNHTWSSDEKIPVQISDIETAKENSKITISFFEFNCFDRLKSFLIEWSNRTHNSVTNEYGSPADLRLSVRLLDESAVMQVQHLTLKQSESPIIYSTQAKCTFYCDFEND